MRQAAWIWTCKQPTIHHNFCTFKCHIKKSSFFCFDSLFCFVQKQLLLANYRHCMHVTIVFSIQTFPSPNPAYLVLLAPKTFNLSLRALFSSQRGATSRKQSEVGEEGRKEREKRGGKRFSSAMSSKPERLFGSAWVFRSQQSRPSVCLRGAR